MIKQATKAIICKDNKFLLQLRDNKKNIYYPNSWGFFGGEVGKGETPENSVKREVKEELSARCSFLSKLFECENPGTGTLVHFFYFRTKRRVIKKNLNEGQDLGWFLRQDMKKIKCTWDVKFFFNLT